MTSELSAQLTEPAPSNPNLIAGILLRGMLPRIAVPFPDEKTGKLDVEAARRAHDALGLMDMMFDVMVKHLTRPRISAKDGTETMQNSDTPKSSSGEFAAGAAPITGSAGQEIIAAIITAGMLPPLPIPELHRAAGTFTDDELRPSAEVVASALNLYTTVLETLRYAEPRLERRNGTLRPRKERRRP